MDSDRYDHLQLTEDGDVLRVAFDRPDSLNALNTGMVREFRDCLEALHDSPPRGVLLTGNGGATCAGLDLSLAEQDPDSDDVVRFNEIFDEGLELLQSYPRPIAYAAKGAAVGAGFIYMLESDFVAVGEDTTLLLPEVKYGLYPTGAVEPLKNQVGERLGKEIALIGGEVDPDRAGRIGLSNTVVPEDDVEDAARELLEGVTQHETAYEKGVIEGVIAEFD
jgi:enoyl-CoA hydratase/carnithine racemase